MLAPIWTTDTNRLFANQFTKEINMKPYITAGRVATLLFAVQLSTTVSFAFPRPPQFPPLPEMSPVLHRETFDEVYLAGISNAEVSIPNYGVLRESWSAYSLLRLGTVTPFVVPGVDANSHTNIASATGSFRAWFMPYWSSISTGEGKAPGSIAVLLEFAAEVKGQTVSLWRLSANEDGSAVSLIGSGDSGDVVLIRAEINWKTGEWHQIVLNYGSALSDGTKGMELILDGEKVGESSGVIVVPPKVARLVVGSSVTGEEPFGGEIDELFCFGKPLRMAFHYLAFKDQAALGSVTEAELQVRAERHAKLKAQREARKALEGESGDGGMMLRMSGPSANCVTNGPVYLTNVLATLTANDGWTVYFDIAGGTNEVVYDIFSTPELAGNDVTNSVWTWLETGMTCETHYFTNQATNQMFYILTVPGADRDGDGMYDGWEWKHFGTLDQTEEGDFDGDGIWNLDEFSGGSDPNTITFTTHYENLYVTNQTVSGVCEVYNGLPAMIAVLVNSTNLTTATWLPYTSNFSATLPDVDTNHVVMVALRGRASDSTAVWDETELTLDRVPPLLVVTNPVTFTAIKPYLQLQGYANEELAGTSYDLTNALGLVTNEHLSVVDQYFDTNKFSFTTNYFQAYDIGLASNLNTITLRVSDLAGNVTTTNIDVTLDYTSATNAPVINFIWPTNGMVVSGDNFYLRGVINDETAEVKAQMVDGSNNTNEITGIVERNGMFWVENLPLAAGTNNISIIATDVVGHLSSSNLVVVKSSVTLTITSTPEGGGLYEPSGTVSGTVSDASYGVIVNGTTATVYDTGDWIASNVPNLGQGTATFDALATPSGGGGGGSTPVVQSVAVEMPEFIGLVEHHATKHFKELYNGTLETEYKRTKDFEAQFQPSSGGTFKQTYNGTADDYRYRKLYGIPASITTTTHYQWSDSDPVGTYQQGASSGPITEDPQTPVKPVPEQDLEHMNVLPNYFYVTHYYARGVNHTWGDDMGNVVKASVSADTSMKLYTGGKARVGRKNLFNIYTAATEYDTGSRRYGRGFSHRPPTWIKDASACLGRTWTAQAIYTSCFQITQRKN